MSMKDNIIEYWKLILEISDWEVTTQRIEKNQIEYDDQKYFIGIERDFNNKKAIIYHDIDLYEEAILHELLHIKHKRIPGTTFEEYEEFICRETDEYLEEFR